MFYSVFPSFDISFVSYSTYLLIFLSFQGGEASVQPGDVMKLQLEVLEGELAAV